MNEAMTLFIALYAAIISTIVFVWDVYKWRQEGPDIHITTSTGMKMVGGVVPDEKTYISISADNRGSRATTITNLGLLYYKQWWKAYLCRKWRDGSFVIPNPLGQQIPHVLEAGARWSAAVNQDEDAERMIKSGYLFVVLYCSTSNKCIRCRAM
ncbi:hypothetical protein NK214_06215 [Chromobacterium sp. S0633]|uniref:hypothetical protein n=1 Tax=Chromobacterium sp. S0633 TaxID=2957805 RepID=UPI00209E9B12|nr:hypothetical protein [Chromobacterium sp. S0633]MCP1289782.1 hypothetical protein [Chromobacterium sp. S0633]